jgi:hypothetical protein
MNINLSDVTWEDISLDQTLPRSRLLATVTLDGVHHHLEAVDPDAGPFSTVQIDGHAYAIFLTPFRY